MTGGCPSIPRPRGVVPAKPAARPCKARTAASAPTTTKSAARC